ncbi:tungstate ABC transporter substrate-binding protein WtpA [Candidatus Aerophobetes bacterium]|uniref:Tungstate ABC transporter substrate-binding protein WtpA n=2 Tax=Aerophobetes bacterium TaxID=2030807 RepID=A0A662DC36_UNCAE|nr:MAG: tungstate ABC transporter substrate-binding protein WtpA [Candidatus Aerophobetes bacterium]
MCFWKLLVSFILLVSLVLPFGEAFAELSGKLIIFHAGSLAVPFEKIEEKFEGKYPNVDILREMAGSITCARKVTDLEKPCDIVASADYRVINRFLIPSYASWNIQFATNQIVLCYTDKSRYSDVINEKNWYEILSTRNVVWGHSDPDTDPCGYRSLILLQLAERYYKKPGLYQRCITNCPMENVRPKSVELISLLQTGNMDYAFEYLSVALQHKLEFIRLPDEINLGSFQYEDFYRQAKVKIAGKKPGEFREVQGSPIIYGITLLKNASNRKAAIAFLKYFLSPDGGLKILAETGQLPIVPSVVSTEKMRQELPGGLQGLVKSLRQKEK